MGIVKPCYKVIVPKAEGNFEIQWDNCFSELSDTLQNPENKTFRICVFIHTIDEADYNFKSGLIRNNIGRLVNGNLLPVSIIPQSPEEPYDVAIELGMVSEKEALVQYYSVDGINYCTISADELLECWVSGTQLSGTGDNKYEAADGSFRKLKLVLDTLELNFDTIVRQWNYVGEILDLSSANVRTMQNYQIFNEVRNSYYTRYRNCSNFPAATGIGMNSVHVGIDCYSIGNQSNIQVISVSNPKQEDSYQYGQDVLVGDAIVHKQAPQFERAILLKSEASSKLIISGTAAIIGQKTIGIGDVVQQTKTTIDNIEALVSRTNLMNHCSNPEEYPDKYGYLRVYVKNRNDIGVVRSVCEEYFGNVPTTFVQADICRDNLLVEIEAEKMNV
jgi:hypothetical protein